MKIQPLFESGNYDLSALLKPLIHIIRNLALCIGLPITLTLFISGCQISKEQGNTLRLIQNDIQIELDNGRIRVVLEIDSSVITQTYFVASEGSWKEVASSYPGSEKTGDKILPLYDKGPGFADDYRLMANDGFDSVKVLEESKDVIRLLLTGTIKGNMIEQTVDLQPDQDYFHIEIKADLTNEAKLEYLLSSFTFNLLGEPDYTFVPGLKRADDDLIGDRKFFAPAAIVEKDGFMMALVPDLNLINENIVYAKGARPQKHLRIFAVPLDTNRISLPTGLNLDLHSGVSKFPLISYGFIDYWVEQHVYWRHENEDGKQVRELSDTKLRYGFDLFLDSEVEKSRGYALVSSFLWKKYGTKYFQMPKPQAMPFLGYAEVCYPATFAYQGYDVVSGAAMGALQPRTIDISISHRKGHPELETWQQWEEEGVAVGGLRLSAPQWYQFIYNTSWWNNVCDATGIFYWGQKQNDSTLIDKARRIINLTLGAPQKEGMFPALYDLNKKSWAGSLWNPPLENYDPNERATYFDWEDGAYQTASASVTAGYLLQYRKTCENNPGIIPFVQRYGDFLIQNMQSNGCVPGWFSKELEPLPSLKWNADGGAHIWVLSELYKVTNEVKYIEAAKKIAHFMIQEVMPRQKWYDFETFYSCAVKPETFFDERTGQYPANNMSLSWALEGFSSLYEVTKNQVHLSAAEACADYSIFYQAIWAPHYIITAYPYGGFSSQNSDAEWLDQRSHRFVNGLVRVGLLSNRQDLIERGVAAMKSSLTLINHPLHIQNEIYKYPNYPLGLGPENIDHEGFPQMPLRSGPSWCEVGGLAGAAHAMNHLGGAYIDFENNIGVGVDGVAVADYSINQQEIKITMKSLLSGLSVPFDKPYLLELRMVGLEERTYTLILNEGPELTLNNRELESLPVIVYSDGRIIVEI
ncbi:MAG: hypothetical protein O2887_02220 [Bacteroidetes bacterium]|nr:hypothetical protein [Bacteroidota bacterium]MDA1119305.1 hypothetical protein [Bacteroidota bacterium]